MLLLDWAARSGAWIIEDDYDSEYRFGSYPIGKLQGMDADARVIYVRSQGNSARESGIVIRMKRGYTKVPQIAVGSTLLS